MEIGVPGVRGARAAMGLVTKPDDGTVTILLQHMAGEIAGALAEILGIAMNVTTVTEDVIIAAETITADIVVNAILVTGVTFGTRKSVLVSNFFFWLNLFAGISYNAKSLLSFLT